MAQRWRRVEIVLPRMHPAQRQVRDHPARFRVLVAGRRWGKTFLGAMECLAVALAGGRAWWVAPTFRMAQIGWRAIRRAAEQVPTAEVRRADMSVFFPFSGGEVAVRSAHDPDALRGEGLDFVVLDEAAFMRPQAWEALRPALSERRGRALFISTPHGRNWFFEQYQRGVQGHPGYAAFRFPTSANPLVPEEELEQARQQLPERVFRQEYLAEFLEDGGVFAGVSECVVDRVPDRPEPGHLYVAGVDWGKYEDFTAVVVVDATTNTVVHVDRFQGLYTVQVDRIAGILQRWQVVACLAEANMSEAAVELLQAQGLPVRRFQTTARSKADIIERLAVAFEERAIRLPRHDVLVGELGVFRAERGSGGVPRYAAPPGFHDDTVMALALAWHARQYAGPAVLVQENPFFQE